MLLRSQLIYLSLCSRTRRYPVGVGSFFLQSREYPMTLDLRSALPINWRVAVCTAAIVVSVPSIAHGQDKSTASLIQRVEQLERANAALEQRIHLLESVMQRDSASGRPLGLSNKWRETANWRGLRTGLSMADVRALLGEPERVDGGDITTWRWADGTATFVLNTLQSWSEPKR